MDNNVFYTIKLDGNFLNSNFMRDDTDHIIECIRFYNEDEARNFLKKLKKDIEFKIVKVTCNCEEIN